MTKKITKSTIIKYSKILQRHFKRTLKKSVSTIKKIDRYIRSLNIKVGKFKLHPKYIYPILGALIFIFITSLLVASSRIPKAPGVSRTFVDPIYAFTGGNKTFDFKIGNKKTNAPSVEFSVSDTSKVSFSMLGLSDDLSRPRKVGKKVIFKDVMTDTDVTYETLPNGVKEEIILHSPTTTNTYVFSMNLHGTEASYVTDEFLSPVFFDNDGNYLFHFEKPFAVDAAGNRTDDVIIQLKRNKDNLQYEGRLVVDHTWLTSPDRVYPIAIDPTVVHDITSEFSTGTFNRNEDTGSGSLPSIETTYQELPADEHTVGLWHMNEVSENGCSGGEDACDSSGNDLHGTESGSPPIVSGKLNNARDFEGDPDYMDLGSDAILKKLTSSFTVEAWIYPDDIPTDHGWYIFTQGSWCSSPRMWGFHINQTTGRLMYSYSVDGSVAFTIYSDGAVVANEWSHIAITSDENGYVNFYINGEKSGGELAGVTATNSHTVKIAGSVCVDKSANFDGRIDEVRLSDIARSPREIRVAASRRPSSTYTSPVIDLTDTISSWNSLSWEEWGVATGDGETAYSSTGLVAQWNFNETSGTTADNAEGTAALDGTLTGFDSTASQDADPDSSWTANNRRWGAGALQFDGTDSVVTVSDSSALTLNDMTVAFWINPSVNGTYDSLIGHYDNGSGGTGDWWNFERSTGTTISFLVDDATTITSVASKTTLEAGQWYHVVGVRDEDSFLKIYINGIEEDSAVESAYTIDSSQSLYIGNQYANSRYFNGTIDTPQIYSRALPHHEILSLYNSSNIELQTRVGTDASPDDGSWDEWSPLTGETQILSLDSDATNWTWDSLAYDLITTDSDDSSTYIEGSGSLKIEAGVPKTDGNVVALWHLDETNGDNGGNDIFDETANNYDGEFWGTNVATAVVDGISGKAREFNGTNDYISLADIDFSSGPFSAEAWFKTTDCGQQIVLMKGSASANQIYLFLNNGAMTGGLHDGVTWQEYTTSETYCDGKWHYYVLNVSTSTIEVFADGVSKGTDTHDNGFPTNNNNWELGRRGFDSQWYFDGVIDEVKISNTNRTKEEIAESYRMGRDHYVTKTISSTDLSSKNTLPFYVAADRPGTYLSTTIGESAYANYLPDANTVGLWHMDEGTNNACNGGNDDVCDSSGNGHHGDATSAPPIVQGKMGKARDFDGSADYISRTTSNFQSSDSLGTIEAWVNIDNQTATHTVFASGDVTGNLYYLHLRIDPTTAKLALLQRNNDAWDYVYGNTVLSIGKWYHVAVVSNGTSYSLYVNGIEQSLTVNNGADTGDWFADTPNRDNITIGANKRSAVEDYFNGLIDEVRISDTARSAGEIRQAYEVGLRTHPITIDFAASLDSGNLITGSGDLSFTIDATKYGLEDKGSALYVGDKLIVRETIDATEYIAQATASAVTVSTGAVTVPVWDPGGTFPSGGFTANATVFKWQEEQWSIEGGFLDSHKNATTNITLRVTDGNEGRTVWLDDLRSAGSYLTTPGGSTITSSTGNQYFQYRALFSSLDEAVSATLSAVTLDYAINDPPSTPSLNTPTDTATNQLLLPALLTTTTDPDSDYLKYKMDVCENVGMSTNCQTFDQTSSQTGWSGQDAETGTAYASGTEATYTIQSGSPLVVGTTYYWRSYAKDPGGTDTWSSTQGTPYSFTVTDAPTPPTTPHAEGSTNPTGVIDLTPEFSAIHNDPNTDSANFYQIEVDTQVGFDGTQMWDSTKTSMTTTADTVRSPDIPYAGTALSLDGTTYYWRVKFWDVNGAQGAWSATQNFSMNDGPSSPTTPYAEGSTNPIGVSDTTPELSAIHNDPDADSADYYQIEVDTQVGFDGTQMWDSTQTAMTTTADTVRSPNISYGGSALSWSTQYYWRIKFWDVLGAEGAWSATQNFTMNVPASTPSLDLPLDTATGQLWEPALKTTTTDSNSDYLRYKIDLCENVGMSTACQTFDQTSSQTGWSGQDAVANTAYASGTQATYTIQTALNPITTYYWRSYAIDPGGTNTWSSTQGTPYSFTTTNAPNVPVQCTIEKALDNSYIDINWVDNSSDEVGFEIERSLNGAAYADLDTTAANTSTYQDSTILAGNKYQYRIGSYISPGSVSIWCYASVSSPYTGTFRFN